MIRSLFLFLVISLLVTSTPETTAGQAATPVPQPLAACTVTPRTSEELHALLGDDHVPPPATPWAVQATPGGEWEFGLDALPDGTPVDSTEVEAVVEQEYSCMAAGDFMRVLALYSDDAILNSRFLSRVGTSMATPDLRTPTPVDERYLPHQTRGLFHARLLPDGRIAAVSPIGEAGLPLLYLFVRNGDQWQIDDIELMGSGYASAGVERNAYTGSEFVFSGTIRYVTYGWGLEWGPAWTPVPDQEHTTIDVAVLTNGVSLVAVGFPGSAPESGPASCVHPTPEDLAARFTSAGLKDVAKAVKQGLTPVNATDGTPLQGAGEDRAFAVYALTSPVEGRIPSDGVQWVSIECRTMADGAWILGITQLVPAADYEAEAVKRDDLMASLEDWDPSR